MAADDVPPDDATQRGDVLACSCGPPGSPAEHFNSADIVFHGTVAAKAKLDRRTLLRVAWSRLLALMTREPDISMETYAKSEGFRVEFSVQRMWRGSASRQVTIFTGRGAGDCGVPFEVGTEYLVYGWCDDEDDCYSFICGRTRRLRNATEDLRYLSSRRTLPLPRQ
jgi:hypothetical protein